MSALLAIRHDQDWLAASSVLAYLLAVVVLLALDALISGLPGRRSLSRDYSDRIHRPYPPRPTGAGRPAASMTGEASGQPVISSRLGDLDGGAR